MLAAFRWSTWKPLETLSWLPASPELAQLNTVVIAAWAGADAKNETSCGEQREGQTERPAVCELSSKELGEAPARERALPSSIQAEERARNVTPDFAPGLVLLASFVCVRFCPRQSAARAKPAHEVRRVIEVRFP